MVFVEPAVGSCNGCGCKRDIARVCAGNAGTYGGVLLCTQCRSQLAMAIIEDMAKTVEELQESV